MKNRIIVMAAAIAAMAISCQKEEIPTPVIKKTEPMVITAGIETKTQLGTKDEVTGITPVIWSEGDQLAIFYDYDGKYQKSAANEYIASDIEGSTATFSGTVVEGTTKIYAIYPYNKALTATANTVTVTIPSTQAPKANTFDNNLNISVARIEKTPGNPSVNAVFENVCSFLKFSVPESIGTIKSVQITSDVNIAGKLTINYKEQTSTISNTSPSKSISMTSESSFAAGSTFWFVVAPVTMKELSITVEATDGYTYTMKKTWSDGLLLEAGKYKNLGTLGVKKAVVEAVHTYTGSVLDGTKVSISLPDKNIKSMNLKVQQAGKDVAGWSKITSLEWNKPEEYPYLPKGDYTISGDYTLTNGTLVTLGDSDFTVGAPFSKENPLIIDHDVYTSYTLYQRSQDSNRSETDKKAHLDLANSSDRMKIYYNPNINPTNLAEEIYGNDAYKGLIERSIQVDNNTPVANEAVVSSVGAYKVKGIFTFDGASSTSNEIACHITGLPYVYDFNNKSVSTLQDNGWSVIGNVEPAIAFFGYSIGGLMIWHRENKGSTFKPNWQSSLGSIITPEFNIPANNSLATSTTLTCGGIVSSLVMWELEETLQFSVGPTNTNTNVSQNPETVSIKTPAISTNKEINKIVMTNNDKYVSITTNNSSITDKKEIIGYISNISLKYTNK